MGHKKSSAFSFKQTFWPPFTKSPLFAPPTQVGSFLPSPELLLNRTDSRLKNFTLSLIEATRQLEILEELDSSSPIIEAVKVVLTEVMKDSCIYVSVQRGVVFRGVASFAGL